MPDYTIKTKQLGKFLNDWFKRAGSKLRMRPADRGRGWKISKGVGDRGIVRFSAVKGAIKAAEINEIHNALVKVATGEGLNMNDFPAKDGLYMTETELGPALGRVNMALVKGHGEWSVIDNETEQVPGAFNQGLVTRAAAAQMLGEVAKSRELDNEEVADLANNFNDFNPANAVQQPGHSFVTLREVEDAKQALEPTRGEPDPNDPDPNDPDPNDPDPEDPDSDSDASETVEA